MTEKGRISAGCARHPAHGPQPCSMVHCSGLPASEGVEDYLHYSLLIPSALITSILNDTLQSLSAFLTVIITDQHLSMQNKVIDNYSQHRSASKTVQHAWFFCFLFVFICELVYAWRVCVYADRQAYLVIYYLFLVIYQFTSHSIISHPVWATAHR